MDNLRSATGWAFDAPDVGDVALGVLASVDALVFEACTQFSWGIQTWAAAALTRVEELDLAQRAAVLAAASLDAFIVGDTNRAVTLGRQGHLGGRRGGPAPALFTALEHGQRLLLSFGGDPVGAAAVMAEGPTAPSP